ncbi:IclR family transcriptional regulator [Halorarum halobium]|uniref:IclR family transcriptional regulator n=1 Tax=Halorarum halobium TaxID=3075121 RepID=UPI0028A7F77E|nr:IclR family transcriptional regulator [Halobaculum sp. XH14]
MSYEAKNPVQATQRSFDIIEALRAENGARLTTIAASLDLPNSTVHNHLSTLMEREYVVKEDDVYRLSLRFLELGEHTRSLRKIHRVAKPELEELAAETGEVASMMIEENGLGVFLFSAQGDDAVPVETSAGTHVSLHETGLGKAILANVSTERVDEIIDRHGMAGRTTRTVVDPAALHEQLAEVRETGIALGDAERIEGIRSVGAPVKDENGRVLGAIGVFGPAGRLSDDRIDGPLGDALENTSNIVELKFTYS